MNWTRSRKNRKHISRDLERTIERKKIQKEAVEREVSEAGKIAGSAKDAVIEFVTQRELGGDGGVLKRKRCEA